MDTDAKLKASLTFKVDGEFRAIGVISNLTEAKQAYIPQALRSKSK